MYVLSVYFCMKRAQFVPLLCLSNLQSVIGSYGLFTSFLHVSNINQIMPTASLEEKRRLVLAEMDRLRQLPPQSAYVIHRYEPKPCAR